MEKFLAASIIKSRAQKRLRPLVEVMPDLRVRFTAENDLVYDVAIEKTSGGFDLVLANRVAGPFRHLFNTVAGRLPAMLYWRMMASDDVGRIVTHMSDGDHWSEGGFLFCTQRAEKTALPDLYFFNEMGFQALRDRAGDELLPWDQRSTDIVWRGGPNGNGYFNVFPDLADHPATRQRIRLAWHCMGSEIDFGFPEPKHTAYYPVLKAAGMLRDRVEHTAWFGKKYAIDIDGFANSWDNLFHRLLMGCCVFKVASDFGFRMWYYDRLKPWEHYVPVRADFADLEERIAWARDHDAEARAIAENGRALANAMSFEAEARVAGQLIDENWERYI
ncbi:glycosyl transferase family 90 [Shimia sp.]|uniref:glycosyl transferase family 90 n=1 Tax=Shimia sp. TaxID=1954381 RepID=UPI00356A0B96